jgi:tRNA A-37 threonylcarbamoyl transferase component Bud32/membrane-associated phospholipid phosphatase
MDAPAEQSVGTAGPHLHPAVREVAGPRRRRPSGEPPPLPHHLQTSGVRWLVATLVLIVLAIVVFSRGLQGLAVDVAVFDAAVVGWLGGVDLPGFQALMRGLAALSSWWVLNGVAYGLVVVLLVLRRFRHLIIWLLLANLLANVGGAILGPVTQRPRPFGVEIHEGWGGWAMPALHVTFFAVGLVAILYTLVPEGRWRNTGKWVVTALVALTAIGRMALGADGPADVLVGVAIGVTIPLLAYRWFAPNEVFPITYRRGSGAHLDVGGARGQAIRRGLEDQLGLEVDEVKPFGLSGSAGSTPLRIKVAGDPPTVLFGKLYARSHLRSDRWYKLGRELLYGRLEDEKAFNTVGRLVQQEDYALRLMRDYGLPTPAPHGVVELTPEREYLLVTEFFADATELGEAEIDTQVIDDGLSIIRKLWDAGLAHRDIKPANLLVREGRLLLIDVAFVQAHPSPWRQAVDLANMMLCLALRSSPELVYQRALRQFSVTEITEGFAATRGLTMPSQLRNLMKAKGHDLHAEFLGLLPERPRPISIQRWSMRRVGLAVLTLLFAAFLLNVAGSVLISDGGVETAPVRAQTLRCEPHEPLLLMAQSVPTASLVPCIEILPAGWSLEEEAMVVGNGRSRFTMTSDRGGVLVTELSASCDLSGAVEVTSERPGARRYLRIERNAAEVATTRTYTFPGGCVTERLVAPEASRQQLAGEASTALDFTTRDALAAALRRDSGGRLELDATTR